MTDRPILFSAPMVLALLEGRKTQTRRLIKRGPVRMWLDAGFTLNYINDPGNASVLPYQPGDRLWVRETFRGASGYDAQPPSRWGNKPIWYSADGTPDAERWSHLSDKERPAIHMPRWASRLTLTVTDVRVQRLQEISALDAAWEGLRRAASGWWSGADGQSAPTTRGAFALLWNSIHGAGAWDANPEVVAITFTVEQRNIDVPLTTPTKEPPHA